MTAVIDASALAPYLVDDATGRVVAQELLPHANSLHLPHLAVVETASVIRGWLRGAQITVERAGAALTHLADFPATRWPHEPLLPRIWVLRDNLSAYDATYVALAEALNASLITHDQRLVRAVEAHAACPVRLV